MASLAVLGYRQIDLSAKVLGILVAGDYLVVMVLDACIILHGGNNGLSVQPFTPAIAMAGAPWIGLMLCFSAFIGFEATTIYSEEARDPEKAVPRATYFSVVLIGVFYTVSTWAVVMGAGVEHVLPDLRALDDPTKFLFALTERYAGHALSAPMRILFVTSIYASLLAFHNSIARYFFSLGRDRLLPARLGQTHPVHQSPHLGSLLQTALASASIVIFSALGADPILTVFTLPSSLATLGIILLMAITSAAILGFFRRRPGAGAATMLATVISLIALLIVLTLATLNFNILTGSNATAPRLLPLLLVIAGIGGALLKPHPSPRPEPTKVR